MSQIAEFHAAVIRHLPEMDTMGKQRWIDDPEGLKKFLSGLAPSFEAGDVCKHLAFFKTRPGLYVTDDFRNCVVAKAESTVTIPAWKHVELTQDMNDVEIEEMLGDGHIFMESEVCALIADLIGKQEKGKKGKLLNNGYANLFYLRSCVVRVYWDADDRKWVVDAWLRDGDGWYRGVQVFSPGN